VRKYRSIIYLTPLWSILFIVTFGLGALVLALNRFHHDGAFYVVALGGVTLSAVALVALSSPVLLRYACVFDWSYLLLPALAPVLLRTRRLGLDREGQAAKGG
jgi:hypothetical protein